MTESRPTGNQSDETSAALDPEGQGFGTWLRCQREGREITLREIADSTKISLRYLQAFEEEKFEVLPSLVFARGFLGQYARYIGLEPEEAVNFFDLARRAGDSEETQVEPRRSVRRTPIWAYLMAIAAVALLLLVVYLLSWYNDRRQGEEPASSPVAVPSSVVPPVSAAAAAGEVAATSTPAALGASPKVDAAGARPMAEGVAPVLAPLRVTVDFTGQCWVEAWIDGVRALSEIRVQGESLQLNAEREVQLTFGDAGVAGVEVNERTFSLPISRGKVLKNLKIDLDTVASLMAAEP